MAKSLVRNTFFLALGYSIVFIGAFIILAVYTDYFFPAMRIAACISIPAFIIGVLRRKIHLTLLGAFLAVGLVFTIIEAVDAYGDLKAEPLGISFEQISDGLRGDLSKEWWNRNHAIYGVSIRNISGNHKHVAVTETGKGIVKAQMRLYLDEKKQIVPEDVKLAAKFLSNAVPGFQPETDSQQLTAAVKQIMENINARITMNKSKRSVEIEGITSKKKGHPRVLDGISITVGAGRPA